MTHQAILWPFYRVRFAVKRLAARVVTVSEICYDCGGWVGIVWTAPDPMWLEVIGQPHGTILCVRCFDARAWKKRVSLRWVPRLLSEKGPGQW